MSRSTGILDKTLSRGKQEVNQSTFAVLYSEIIRYAQKRVNTDTELHDRLAAYGKFVGERMLDVIYLREKGYKRETKLLPTLIFIKSVVWKNLFNKEADKLEKSNDDSKTYLLIESSPMVNSFISIPKDKPNLNCAAFVAGIVEAMLTSCNFPCRVSAHWHNGTAYMIQFDDAVIARENALLNNQ